MPTFASFDGVEIWYDDQVDDGRAEERADDTVVLVHGFGADTNLNFVRSGILDALVDAGFRVVAIDLRGHGLSAKPHDPAAYADDATTRDVRALLDHLGVTRVAVVGFSMGASIALELAEIEPRVERAVAIGVGAASLGRRNAEGTGVRDALLADDPETISDPLGRQFRRLADSIRADRVALAASITAPHRHLGVDLDAIAVPVLVVAGADDDLAGDPAVLAAEIPGGRSATVPGNHFDANAQPALHHELVTFLGGN